MEKEILKAIAGVMAATLFISGCGVKEKPDTIDEADEPKTTEVAAEASTEASTEASDDTANKEDEPADLLPEVQETFADSDEEVLHPEVGSELSFRGYYSYQGPEMPRFFVFEDSDYDVDFDSMIGVDLTSEQGDFVLANPYEEFEITFVLTEKSMYGGEIYHVTAENIEIVRESPAAAAYYDASTDPLNGLVADDILTKFRATNRVKDMDSVSEEGIALGHWAQRTIGKDGFSDEVREMGRHIGNRYEFCFGTDIGNNFDNNVPYMYGVYYALKDYFTSDGKNSKEYYEGLVEDNEGLGTGDPEWIKDMYLDLQEIISVFNGIIREQQ
ncbi:hypothetical protein [Butyrivibrio sp. XPD2006]|uniref:hypothetical protein n=1 Tax=Butyrivibrio sp. XPD2006 TaxID=1280668 RepID=UPI0003B415A9|nr:hypothetical protein [Butyrivibrio sp. XPD2006]